VAGASRRQGSRSPQATRSALDGTGWPRHWGAREDAIRTRPAGRTAAACGRERRGRRPQPPSWPPARAAARRAGRASRRSVGGRPPRRSGRPRSCGVPGADHATIHEERRSSGRAAAGFSAAPTLVTRVGDSKGAPLGTAPQCQGIHITHSCCFDFRHFIMGKKEHLPRQ